MIVNVKLLKDYAGYKAGQTVPLLSSYLPRLVDQGIVTPTMESIDRWYVMDEEE
jgi:hypothetical protein